MRRLLSLALIPLTFAGACAVKPIADPWYVGIDLPTSYADEEVALRIEEIGGFTAPEYILTRVPTVTVYGDGRVIAQGAVDTRYPGPALPAIVLRVISAQAVGDLAELALHAGVGERERYDQPQVMDANTTRFTLLTTDGPLVTSVYALTLDQGVPREEYEARLRLRELRDQLLDLPTTLGAENAGEPRPYEPVALAAVNEPWSPIGPEQPEVAWPGPALPGAELPNSPMPGLTCLLVIGEDLPQVLAAAADANQETPWTWDDQAYRLFFRPLLPDESSCEDLGVS